MKKFKNLGLNFLPLRRPVYLAAVIIFAFFLTSLITRLSDMRAEITAWYPDPLQSSLSPETKRISANFWDSQQKKLLPALEAWLTGPSSVELRKPASEGIKITSALLKNKILYLNLNRYYFSSMSSNQEVLFVESLKKTLQENFPKIQRVELTFGGRSIRKLSGSVDYSQGLDLR